MSTVPPTLREGIDHHRAGRLSEAAAIYRRILSADPRHAEAMHLLGVVAHQTGQHDAAIRLISGAIQIDGSRGAYYSNLGEACRAAGKLDEAKRSFLAAIQHEPNMAAAHYNLARIHAAQGNYTEAANRCRQAVALVGDHAESHNLLGNILESLGQADEARVCFERAVACNPTFYDALLNLAGALARAKQFDQAADYLRRALQVRPESSEAHLRLGDVHSVRGDWPAAIAFYQKALQFDPRNATAECHWAMTLQAQEQFDDAVAHYRRALELAPDDVETHLNLAATLGLKGDEDQAAEHHRGVLEIDPTNSRALALLGGYLQQQEQFAEALAHYDRAIAKSPDDARLRFYRGLLLLAQGDLAAGWQGYRWRTKTHDVEGPQWNGNTSSETTLLVHTEQGLGDTMQFVRYLPLVRQRVARSMLVVPQRLVPLLKESGCADVLGFSDPLPKFDCKISLLDLPRVLGTTVETIPAEIPYLVARESLVREWSERLGDVVGFRVGICWQGNPKFSVDHLRSVPLQAFTALARVPGVRLISLQTYAGLDQLAALGGQFDVVDLRPQFEIEDGAFLNAAAVMRNLDLVVTVDTAIAHLAGALGMPVWVALSARPDWRWLLERDDSPWYPTMRLFRQAKLRDWPQLFDRIAAELPALVATKRGN